MKSNLNLFELTKKSELSKDAQKKVLGGCGCGCYYEGCGGSSTSGNGCANADQGISSRYLGYAVSEGGALC